MSGSLVTKSFVRVGEGGEVLDWCHTPLAFSAHDDRWEEETLGRPCSTPPVALGEAQGRSRCSVIAATRDNGGTVCSSLNRHLWPHVTQAVIERLDEVGPKGGSIVRQLGRQ